MLQRLIHNAKVNVFESARFYYWLLWLLVGYSILREFIQKFTFVYYTNPFIFPREIIGVLFFVFAFCSIISVGSPKKIENKFYIFLGSILVLSIFNELRYMFIAEDYSIIESLKTSQVYYVAKILFLFIFRILANY